MLVYFIMAALSTLTMSDNPIFTELGKALFDGLDANKDGLILPFEAETFFLGFDTNKDSVVSYQEFVTSLDSLQPAFKGHELALFNLFDLERDTGVDQTDIDTVFKVADANGDGVVTETEFTTIFMAVVINIGP